MTISSQWHRPAQVLRLAYRGDAIENLEIEQSHISIHDDDIMAEAILRRMIASADILRTGYPEYDSMLRHHNVHFARDRATNDVLVFRFGFDSTITVDVFDWNRKKLLPDSLKSLETRGVSLDFAPNDYGKDKLWVQQGLDFLHLNCKRIRLGRYVKIERCASSPHCLMFSACDRCRYDTFRTTALRALRRQR